MDTGPSTVLLAPLDGDIRTLYEENVEASGVVKASAVVDICDGALCRRQEHRHAQPLCEVVGADIHVLKHLGVVSGSYVSISYRGNARIVQLIHLCLHQTDSLAAEDAGNHSEKQEASRTMAPVLIPPTLSFNLGIPYAVQPGLLSPQTGTPAAPPSYPVTLSTLASSPSRLGGEGVCKQFGGLGVAAHVSIATLGSPVTGPWRSAAVKQPSADGDDAGAKNFSELLADCSASTETRCSAAEGAPVTASQALQHFFLQGSRCLAVGDVFAVAVASDTDSMVSKEAVAGTQPERLMYFKVLHMLPCVSQCMVVEAQSTRIVLERGYCRSPLPVGWSMQFNKEHPSSATAAAAAGQTQISSGHARQPGCDTSCRFLGFDASAVLSEPAYLPGA